MNAKDFFTVSLLVLAGLVLGKQIAVLLKKQGVELVA